MQNLLSSSENKKEKEAIIFDAACKVFRRKGFHQARIVDISQTAGISYGLVYHYFKSKADLFDAIQREWWETLLTMMDATERKATGPEEKLAAIVHHFLEMYEKRPDMVYIFITEISRASSNLTPDRLEWFKVFMDRTEAIIVEAQDRQVLRSDVRARYLTYIFLGALETFISTMVLQNQRLKGRAQKQRIASALLDVFFNGARLRV
ncbi:TetR/AcrR family transcriptional regulator [Desulfomonile tiedjei]|uniref:Transcriptional regulator n=1 Tax=Desulfomonile tiedjei (strain ATCC 49306 / DSM 6799 / DCB-1) TaxID=706587 RepID=I4CF49_DESTA|nr:TetR/AcrR family transcriptional regulator [Desulfomonile tiedjei]AFM28190.1 transcriptional regulator [Desulfomonile tiedjei DSM 6799]